MSITIILIGGPMTLTDGSVIDSRQLLNGSQGSGSYIPNTNCWPWWEIVTSIVDPLLTDMTQQTGEHCIAEVYGPATIRNYDEGKSKRLHHRLLPPEYVRNVSGGPPKAKILIHPCYGGYGELGSTNIRVGSSLITDQTLVVPHTQFSEAIARDYAAGHKIPKLMYVINVPPALTQAAIKDWPDTEIKRWVQRYAQQRKIWKDTSSRDSRFRRTPEWQAWYDAASPEERHRTPRHLVTPAKGWMDYPDLENSDFRITGLVHEGEWCDPDYLEAARLYRKYNEDIKFPIWDLTTNEDFRDLLDPFLTTKTQIPTTTAATIRKFDKMSTMTTTKTQPKSKCPAKSEIPPYQMPSHMGGVTVHRMVTLILSEISTGKLQRADLEGRVCEGSDWVADQGHPEAREDATQHAIQDAINKVTAKLGWEPIAPWGW
jgi:hypothetical protein